MAHKDFLQAVYDKARYVDNLSTADLRDWNRNKRREMRGLLSTLTDFEYMAPLVECAEKHRVRIALQHDLLWQHNQFGHYDFRKNTVVIDSNLDTPHTVIVLAHEFKHVWDEKNYTMISGRPTDFEDCVIDPFLEGVANTMEFYLVLRHACNSGDTSWMEALPDMMGESDDPAFLRDMERLSGAFIDAPDCKKNVAETCMQYFNLVTSHRKQSGARQPIDRFMHERAEAERKQMADAVADLACYETLTEKERNDLRAVYEDAVKYPPVNSDDIIRLGEPLVPGRELNYLAPARARIAKYFDGYTMPKGFLKEEARVFYNEERKWRRKFVKLYEEKTGCGLRQPYIIM